MLDSPDQLMDATARAFEAAAREAELNALEYGIADTAMNNAVEQMDRSTDNLRCLMLDCHGYRDRPLDRPIAAEIGDYLVLVVPDPAYPSRKPIVTVIRKECILRFV